MNQDTSELPKEVRIKQQAIPASPTALTSTTTDLIELEVTNGSGGTLTLTVTDVAATTKLIDAVSIGTGVTDVFKFNSARLNGGMTWGASGTGMYGSVFGRKLGGFTGITTMYL